MPTESDMRRKVLPIVGLSEAQNPTASQVLGTGFVATDGVLVACWHYLSDALAKGWTAVAALEQNGQFQAFPLTDIEQHPGGLDLATARVGLPGSGWRLPVPERLIDLGSPVATFGYPLPSTTPHPEGGFLHTVSLRMLRGYITHMPVIEHPPFPPTVSMEIDMPAPAGLSGAPLLSAEEPNLLLGVVYGMNAVDTVEAFASVDPETGERTPEINFRVSFALAHHARNLHSLRGVATEGKLLRVLMAERGETV